MEGLIYHLTEEKAIRSSERREDKKVQIGVRLEPRSVRFLDQLCEQFDMSRTALAQSILAVGIHEAATIVGLDTKFTRDDMRSALLDMGMAGTLVQLPGDEEMKPLE